MENNIIEFIKRMVADGVISQEVAEKYCPELKEESKDEKIRKSLINYFKRRDSYRDEDETWEDFIPFKEIISYLEKQGEQKPQGKSALEAANEEKVDNQNCVKPTDKIEPKFKNGQWIVWQDKCYKVNYNGCGYELVDQDGLSTSLEYGTIDENAHIWDITKDAKDGDVLASNRSIFIFSQEYIAGKPEAHCGIMNGLFLVKPEGCWTNEKCYPATKEQRNTLMKAIADAGYTFDFEKKELKEIERKSSWSEEDEKMLNDIIMCGEHHCYLDAENIAWLESLKDRVQPQQKQEWKQENTGDLTSFENAMMHIGCSFFGDNAGLDPNDTNAIKEQANLLLELVPSKEWSEEDERILVEMLKIFNIEKFEGYNIGENNEDALKFLKSLRPQTTWKPSDRQMASITCAVRKMKESACYDSELVSLLDDLKKLKRE